MLLFIYGLEVVFTSVIWFQYITCYSLSGNLPEAWKDTPSFNTSHVTLYHEGGAKLLTTEDSFNTSHVTLYQSGNL